MLTKTKKSLLLASIFTFILTGCKSSETMPRTAISIPTGDSTGALYQIGTDISNVLNDNITYLTATAETSKGGLDNLNQLKSMDNTVTFAVTSIAYESYTGTGNFVQDANPNLRVIAGLYYNPNQIIVKNNDSINTLEDLVGMKFSPGALGSTTVKEAKAHFSSIGIDMESSMDIINAGFSDSIVLMQKDQLDGAWIMAGIPNEAVTTVTEQGDGKLIGLSDSSLEVLKSKYPWYVKYIIPAGTYANQTEDIQTSAVKLVIVASCELDDDIAYDITKTFWENIDKLKLLDPALCSVNVEGSINDISDLPLHNGAKKYYKEKGIIK